MQVVAGPYPLGFLSGEKIRESLGWNPTWVQMFPLDSLSSLFMWLASCLGSFLLARLVEKCVYNSLQFRQDTTGI